jgi:2-oxoglutarate dehydrogenase E2 component (dihydrolipoamide succinyltransferase)
MADILTPALGESVTEATIARWTKKAGDPVRKDEVLVELDTDKVSLEVVSPADGVLGEIAFKEGDTITPGAVLGRVDAAEGATARAQRSRPRPKRLRPRPPVPIPRRRPAAWSRSGRR